MAYTIPTTATLKAYAANFATGQLFNRLAQAVIDLWNPPAVQLARSTTLNVPTGATSVVATWDLETQDSDAMHSASGSELTANTAGRWRVIVHLEFSTNSTGTRQATVRRNAGGSPGGGVSVAAFRAGACPTGVTTVDGTAAVFLNKGDTVEVFPGQDSGSTLTLNTTSYVRMEYAGAS